MPKEYVDILRMVLIENNIKVSRLQVLAAVFQGIQAFWDVMLCRWVDGSRRFEGP